MIIAIIGNIATGKTTLLKSVDQSFNVTVVEEMRSAFLEDYLNGKAVAFHNQVHYYLQCLRASEIASKGNIVIQDR